MNASPSSSHNTLILQLLHSSLTSLLSTSVLLDPLKNAQTEDAYNDVYLKGIDAGGTSIPASRVFLSSRSEFFHAMFFGNFKESSTTSVETVHLNFSTATIQQYIVNNWAATLTMLG